MKCISSPALNDIDVARFVDGEAEAGVEAHMRECPYCRERARQWTRVQQDLRRQLYRADCPNTMDLGEYSLGLLTDPQRLVIAQHLRVCSFCRRETAILDDFLQEPVPGPGLWEKINVLTARLISGPKEVTAALRGAGQGPLTFEVDDILVVLDIHPSDSDRASVSGQIAAGNQEEWTAAEVEIRKEGQLQSSARVDDLGAFQFEGIPPGHYEMRIGPKNETIVLIMLEVQI